MGSRRIVSRMHDLPGFDRAVLDRARQSRDPRFDGKFFIAVTSDIAQLTALNQDYVDAVRTSNVKRFEESLAQDFLCTLGDGRQIDRKQFLEEIAKPMKASNLEVHDVNVRLMGDFAIVHARTTYTTEGGEPGESRYTDVWARRDGRWLAVSAQITRVAAAK
jgi:uncharacterized protein (TIGR02246 family)